MARSEVGKPGGQGDTVTWKYRKQVTPERGYQSVTVKVVSSRSLLWFVGLQAVWDSR